MNNAIKHKKIISGLFLAAYIAFAVMNAMHFHAYAFFPESSFNNINSTKWASSHYLTDNGSICVIHQFSSSILDLKFSSDDLSTNSLSGEKNELLFNDKLTSLFSLSKNSPRAPPVFS
ncbi:MAG: hypothetical protein HXY50_01485 [Ignavibacteriaceae bacterium]|nr:hypothetical protein [Ignavibacteriaceae bacterium]